MHLRRIILPFLLVSVASSAVAQPEFLWAILSDQGANKQLIGTCFFTAPDTFVTSYGVLGIDSIPAHVPVRLWHPRLGSTRIDKIAAAFQELDMVIGKSFARACQNPLPIRPMDLPQLKCRALAYAYYSDSTGIHFDSLFTVATPNLFRNTNTGEVSECYMLSTGLISGASGAPILSEDGRLIAFAVQNTAEPRQDLSNNTALSAKYLQMIFGSQYGKTVPVITTIQVLDQ